MADGIELASAYIQIIPSLKGASRKIEAELAGIDTGAAGRKVGKRLGEDMSAELARSIDMRAAGAKLQQGGKALRSFGGATAAIGSKLTAGFTLPLATAAATVGAFSLKTAGSAEVAEASFTTMLGSAQAARDMMETLADFAASTPFELAGLQDATKKLLAYGFTADDVVPMLTSVGDATAALGTGQAGIDAVTRALGQMRAKGKVSSEEMLQLTEQGIPAWEFLAEAIGTDTAGAMDLVSKGAVDAQTGIDALTAGMDAAFGGTMQQQASTLTGIMSNLADAIQQPLMELRDTEGYDRLGESLKRVTESAGPFVESLLPHIESGFDAVADVLESAADAMDGFSEMSEDGQAQIVGLVGKAALAGPALLAVGKGAGVAGGALELAGKATEKAGDLLARYATKTDGASKASGGLAGGMASLLAKVSPLHAGLAALAVGGVALFAAAALDAQRRSETAAEALGVLESASRVAEGSIDGAAVATDRFGSTALNLTAAIDANWQAVADLSSAFEDIDEAASAQLGSLSAARRAIESYSSQADLTAQQQGALRAAVESVNSACGTSYTVAQDAGGAYVVMGDGATVAKDEIYALIDAQMQQARVTAQMDKLEELYTVQADQAADYAEALAKVSEAEGRVATAREAASKSDSPWVRAELADAENDLERLSAAAGDFKGQLDKTGESIAATEASIGNMSAASSGAVEGFAALAQGSQGVNALFEQTGMSMDDFAADLEASGISLEEFRGLTDTELMEVAAMWDGSTESIVSAMGRMGEGAALSGDALAAALGEAGVSTQLLNEVGTANLDALAEACRGDMDAMVFFLEGYNATPLVDKDGNVAVESAQLIDAQGRLWTWNGSTLVDKDGNAAIADQQVVDAQGHLYTWNGSNLQYKDADGVVHDLMSDGIAKRDAWNKTGLSSYEATGTINIFENITRTISSIFTGEHASGGIRLHAEGGISTAARAGVPVIATRAVPLDIVGEDGAEAIVPLTNKRYSQPFVDLIADGVAGRMGGGQDRGSREVISWLDANLPAIIARYTPVMGESDAARWARKAVDYAV